MIDHDIARILVEMHTFTSVDLAKALDMPEGTAGARLSDWTKEGYVVRIKSSRTFVYAPSAKTLKIVAKLPPVDPDERVLPLWLPCVETRDCDEYDGGFDYEYERIREQRCY